MPSDQKPIPEQMKMVAEKWDPTNPNCAFKAYLYNKVDEHTVPLYGPGPNEDPKEWEEALQHKPAPSYIPVLCAGFPSIIARVTLQRRVIVEFNNKLHAINASLDAILSRHDLEHTVRALNARRRHAELSKRCLVLASRVQVLRNRGYALSGDEDELKQKLAVIDKSIQDPALSARMEELWSRLIILRGYADNMKDEINKPGFADGEGLGEEIEAKAKKVRGSYCLTKTSGTDDQLTLQTDPRRLREAAPTPQETGRGGQEGLWRLGEAAQSDAGAGEPIAGPSLDVNDAHRRRGRYPRIGRPILVEACLAPVIESGCREFFSPKMFASANEVN